MLLRPRRDLVVFSTVWLGQLVSLLGSGLTEFALGVWIYMRTGSATQFALSFLFSSFPRIVLSPFAGALVDRWDRRHTMMLSDLGAGLTTLVIAGLLWTQQLDVWHIYLLMGISSIFSTFQRPAYAASITVLVPAKHLGRANGMVGVAHSAASLLAPGLAGFLITAAGIEYVLLIDVATFLFAVTTLLAVRFPPVPAPAQDADTPRLLSRSLVREISDGWRCIASQPGLLGLTITFAAASFFGITTEVLITPYVLSFSTPAALGVIASVSGAGLLTGGLAMSVWGGPRRLVYGILGFELLVSLATIFVGATPSLWLVGSAVFVYFATIALGDDCSHTFWQRKIPPAMQGRVFALRQMITLSTFPLGIVLIAPLAEYVFEPLLVAGGAWAGSIGHIAGIGPGRGIGFTFILAGLVNLSIIMLALIHPRIREADVEVLDHPV